MMKKKLRKTENKIRLAHLIARMGTGGAEENTLYTIQGLDKNKYQIDLIAGDEFGRHYERIFQNEKMNVIKIRGFIGNLSLWSDMILFFRLILLFYRNKYVIVHTHGTKAGIIGRIAAKITGIPIIIQGLHGNALGAFSSQWLNGLFILLERIAGRFTDAHISVSYMLSQKYLDKKIGKAENYYTVRSGMDLKRFAKREKVNSEQIKRELHITAGDFVVGNISRLELIKGHEYLLKAMKIVTERQKEKRIILLVIGEGQEKKKLLQNIMQQGMEKKVILTGYRHDIPELLAVMSIFVFTSMREGLPRVLVQAAAASLPLIAFNIDGIPEIIKDGYNGFLVEPKNINQLAAKIERYLMNPELIRMHGDHSKNMVKNRWTIEGMVSKTEEIYRKLIKEKLYFVDNKNKDL